MNVPEVHPGADPLTFAGTYADRPGLAAHALADGRAATVVFDGTTTDDVIRLLWALAWHLGFEAQDDTRVKVLFFAWAQASRAVLAGHAARAGQGGASG